MDVYINEGGPSGYPHKRKSLENSTESIYENVMIHSLEPNRTGPALSGNEHMQTGCYVYTHTVTGC